MSSATVLESEATFQMQAQRAGLTQSYIDCIKAAALGTLGKLAYAVTTPGTSPTDVQVNNFLAAVRPGIAPSVADTTAMKRIVFEAQTLTIANLRSSMVSTDDTAAKKVAPAERTARIEEQKNRLRGLDLSGPMEPSYWLYDSFSAMMDSGELKYIPPNRCLTRQQEIAGSKPDKQIKLDENKTGLVIKDADQEREISVASDLSLFQAMCRRGLAMDLVGIASYDTVMRWTNRMFTMYTQAPAPGFSKVTQAQLLRADRQSFLRLAEMVTGGFKPNVAGTLPLDEALDRLHTDVTVTYHMLPLPQGKDPKADKDPKDDREGPYGKGKKGKSKKSGKGQGGDKRFPMPAELHGMHHQTPSGKPICYNFNLNRCSDKGCKRQHVCCVPGCYKKHPQTEHAWNRHVDSGTTAQSESSRKAGTSDECVVSVPENGVSPVHDAPVVVEQNVSTELPLPSNDAASTSEFDFLLQPFAIELFCGSAGLTATMRSLMPSSFGVDHSVIRPKSRVIQLNLLEECNQKLVQEWALHPNCLWLHFGVPCGTASRAREIRLNQFAHGPPPLRDKRFPDGLPPIRLSAKNLLRVRSANRLYKFMMVLILMLPANKVWTIENPLRSWLWATSYIRAIKRRLRTFFGRFDMCMFGGKRFKKTGILTNCKHVMSFQATCDNRHKHIPFKVRSGKFDTSLEAEYPTRFCKVLTRAVAEHLSTAFGIKWNFQQLKSSQLAAVAAGKQPKGMPNLIHEFAAVVPVHGVPVDVDFPTSGKQQLKRCFSFVTSNEPIQVHKGAKLLRRTMKGGSADATEVTLNKSGAHSLLDLCNNPLLTSFPGSEPQHLPSVECNACSPTCDDCLAVRLLDNKPSCDVVFGIPWDPVEFTNKACDIGHPQNIVLGLLPEVRDAIKVVSETPVDQIVKERGQWFNK